MSAPQLLGHRGDPEHHPENTLEGFLNAVRCGADGVELDVQVSRDGVPVVIHDATLDRTTHGHGDVGAHTWPELDALGVPGLVDVLEALRDRVVAVELKPSHATHPHLADGVLAVARDVGAAHISLLSFDHAHLRAGIDCVALVRELPPDPLALLDACGAAALGPRWELIDDALCTRLRGNGRRVVAWTVDDVNAARRLARMGVSAIVSNRPCALRRALAA
jgi:glycerophosphoryl diester phosphodiesterase